jgi:small subunit ribosomal protein S4e
LAQNRREVKKAIHKKDLMVSNKLVADEKKPVELFDTITIIPSKKNYRLSLGENGKYTIEEIAEKDAKSKVSKVIGKKSIAGKKTQINLLDGRNYLSDVKCNVNDSVIIDLEKNTISKVLPVKEKAEVLVIGGKHSGARAKITKLIPERKMVEVDTKENKYNVLIEHLIVTA